MIRERKTVLIRGNVPAIGDTIVQDGISWIVTSRNGRQVEVVRAIDPGEAWFAAEERATR